MYVHERPNWPACFYDPGELIDVVARASYLQGELESAMRMLGFKEYEATVLQTLTADVVKSSEIEGELLNSEQVRSSIARRLGFSTAGLVASSRNVDAVVEMALDANRHCSEPLTHERLWGWQAALFPTGYSGMHKVDVGKYRTGEMQVVSGAMGHERVHYVAPPAERVKHEMDQFLEWFNSDEARSISPIICAAHAHWWFIMIHPFDDGNGRIARALSDMALSRAFADEKRQTARPYSLSAQMLQEKKRYYEILERDGLGEGNLTEWYVWFANCLCHAIEAATGIVQSAVDKARFWSKYGDAPLNERQRKILNRLFDGFEGKLNTSKWAKICHCSQDTALNDIKALIGMGVLESTGEGGRSTNYRLAAF